MAAANSASSLVERFGEKLTLRETHYVPEFKVNILSGQKIIDSGRRSARTTDRVYYMNKNGTMAMTGRRVGTYWGILAVPALASTGLSAEAAPPVTLKLRHQRSCTLVINELSRRRRS